MDFLELIYGTSDDYEKIRNRKIELCDSYYLPMIKKYLNTTEDKTILDFGSGEGVMAKRLASNFKKYYCLDINEDFLKLCKDYNKNSTNVEYKLVKDLDLDIELSTIDVIISHAVFELMDSIPFLDYIQKFYNVMKKDSVLFFDFWDTTDKFKYDRFNPYFTMKKLEVKNWLDEMGFECIEDTQYSHAYKRETQMSYMGFRKV